MSDQNDTGGALAPRPTGRLIVPPGTPIEQWPTTLPDTPDGWKLRLNAMGPSDHELGRDGTVLMELQHVLAYPRDDVDEDTGEYRQYSWLVIIDPEGRTFGTSSEVVAHRVAAIVDLVRAGKLALPVAIQISERRAKKTGRTYHDLKLI